MKALSTFPSTMVVYPMKIYKPALNDVESFEVIDLRDYHNLYTLFFYKNIPCKNIEAQIG